MRLKVIIFFIGIFVSLFFVARNASAQQACSSFDVQPDGGDSTTNFSLTALGCGTGQFYLRIFDTESQTTVLTYEIFINSEDGLNGYTFVGPNSSGNYLVRLYEGVFGLEVLGEDTISISGVFPLECGDIVEPNDPQGRCPDECIARLRQFGSVWWCSCGGNNQLPCPEGNYFGEPECLPHHYLGDNGRCVYSVVGEGPLYCEDGFSLRTAVGCVPIYSIRELVGFFMRLGIAIGGGISFLLILYGVIVLMTSRGDREKTAQAREIIVGAIGGIVILIFSVFVLRVLGVDILQIPGFGA